MLVVVWSKVRCDYSLLQGVQPWGTATSRRELPTALDAYLQPTAPDLYKRPLTRTTGIYIKALLLQTAYRFGIFIQLRINSIEYY